MNNYEQATQEVKDAFDALCKGRVKAAVEAEREACAKVADEHMRECEGKSFGVGAAIRARSQA